MKSPEHSDHLAMSAQDIKFKTNTTMNEQKPEIEVSENQNEQSKTMLPAAESQGSEKKSDQQLKRVNIQSTYD